MSAHDALVPPSSPRPGRRWRIHRRGSSTTVVCCAAVAVLLSYSAPSAHAFVLGASSGTRSPAWLSVMSRDDDVLTTVALSAVRKRRTDFSTDGAPYEKIARNSVDVLASAGKTNGRKRRGGGDGAVVAAPNPLRDQFRPRQISHLEIVVPEEATLARNGRTREPLPENEEAKARKSIVDSRIAELLSDDDEEEDGAVPDGSSEAANEIADRRTYARLSDVAKLKAQEAMSKSSSAAASSSPAETEPVLPKKQKNKAKAPTGKTTKKRRLTASVQETGRDTIKSYTKSFTNHELLSREAEAILGRQIQILVRWEERRMELEVELLRAPTFAQWAEAVGTTVPELKKQIRKSQRAKAALIEANLRLVVTSARQTVKQNRSEISFHDACQDGIIGLTRACEKFDPDKEFRFATYALWWIKGEIHRSISNQSSPIRLPANARKKINAIRINERILMTEMGRKPTDEEIAEKSGMTLEQLAFYRRSAQDVLSIDQTLTQKGGKGSQASGDSAKKVTEVGDLVKDAGPSPTELASKQMLKEDVRRLVKTLSPREQVVIRMRFGLDDGSPKSLDDIGKKFRVEKDRIRQIEARAMLKLRQPYRSQAVESYVPDL